MRVNIKWVFLIFLSILILTLILIVYFRKKPDETKNGENTVIMRVGNIPNEFYMGQNTTTAVVVEKEVEVSVETTKIVEVSVEKVVQAETPLIIPSEKPKDNVSFADLLNIETGFFKSDDSSKKLALHKIYQSSSSFDSKGKPLENNTPTLFDGFNIKDGIVEQPRKKDADYLEYEAIGIARIKTTFPVDLDRVIIEGAKIPILLNGELNSELAGEVEAWVMSDIYGFHGNKILLPQGTFILGTYNPIEKIGQQRLDIIWHRAVTPRGQSIKFDSLSDGFLTTDIAGQSGVYGEIDNKFTEKYGLPFLIALMNAALEAGVEVNSQAAQNFVASIGETSQQVTTEILQQFIDINPTMRLNTATELQIRVNNDIWFKPIDGYIN